MSRKPLRIPDEIVEKQRDAANPSHSAWVTANAGSGKTHVLSRRVMRLLLEGTDPARILCLTYTRAAAAEMSNRVFRDLGKWAVMDAESLRQAISDLEGRSVDSGALERARRLFARALETPGGLKIQTIHAFCEAVLHRFPLEANIAGRFELADAATEGQLLVEARRRLLVQASEDGGGELESAFLSVLRHGNEAGFETLLAEIMTKRGSLAGFVSAFSGAPVKPALLDEFGFADDEDEQSIAAQVWPLAGFDGRYIKALLDHAGKVGKKAAQDFASTLADADRVSAPFDRLDVLGGSFLTANGAPRSTRNICANDIVTAFPDLADRFLAAAGAVKAVRDRLALFRMIDATAAAMTVAAAFIGHYDRLKTARGLLDFNDLIEKTAQLLDRRDAGPWIQYKLDKGIDHILVDEAQDTSPSQWAVITRLAREFFTGQSARSDTRRTIFAVGDEKQSIYSFQGADPDLFDEYRHRFGGWIDNGGGRLQSAKLQHSFRSTPDVLDAVDWVFGDEELRSGLTRDPEDIVHRAIRKDEAGFVQLWGSIGETAVDQPEDWRDPVDHQSAAPVKLAETMAQTIAGWIRDPAASPLSGAPLQPGDIMVLVRKRDRFMNALSRALKNLHVPVAGVDRIRLRDHIAVKDMMALGRFVMQPDDDLSLAELLKSPIFGFDDDALMEIAIGRPQSGSLLDALSAADGHREIVEKLENWRNQAFSMPVFEFYARVLGRDEVRKAMIARLGNEAADLLDEFLNSALAFERSGGAGLEAFLNTVDKTAQEVKREADSERREVRIMTVHAAKGLESRLVFLVDGGGAPVSDTHLPKLLPVRSKSGKWADDGFLWYPSSAYANEVSRGVIDHLKKRAGDEYHRLLYVGMTRAEDALVVCGYHGKRDRRADTWHAIVERRLSGSLDYALDTDIGLPVMTFRTSPAGQAAAGQSVSEDVAEMAEPPYLRRKVSPAAKLPRPLAPSGVSAVIEDIPRYESESAVSPVRSPVDEPSFAVRRGIAIHRLLQKLPDLAPGDREGATKKYLDVCGSEWSETQRSEVARSVLSLLENRDFAAVFAPGSSAEVAVMGTLEIDGKPHAVSAKMDRVAVGDGRVLIVDYKTNRPPPRGPDDIPQAYVAQMALYRALVAPLYPGLPVICGLVFTETPQLIMLSDSDLKEALARLNMS